MLERRFQILLDADRYGRVEGEARRRNLSVAAVIREAIDLALPARGDERATAARVVLDAQPMPVPEPDELRAELDALRARRG